MEKTKSTGYDCVMIPGATKASNKSPVPNSICGNGKGLVTLAAGTTSATVCSKFNGEMAFWCCLPEKNSGK